MASIKIPKWLPAGSYPTQNGWVSSKGEMLKRQKFTAEELAEWQGSATSTTVAPVIQMLTEAPSVQSELNTETIKHYYSYEDFGDVADDY